jgi:hypothetical protein
MAGVKHFVVVGLLFAVGVGWLLTALVNPFVGLVLEATAANPQEGSYVGALVLTGVSLTLISASIVGGNWVFVRWFGAGSITRAALTLSTTLFVLTVLVIFGSQLAAAVTKITWHLSYSYNHPWDAAKLLSLPVLRLSVLPLCFFLAGRVQASKVAHDRTGVSKGGPAGA